MINIYIGLHIGTLLIESQNQHTSAHSKFWNTMCSCGRSEVFSSVVLNNMRDPYIVCSYCAKQIKANIIFFNIKDNTFGRLKPIEICDYLNQYGHIMIKCLCLCGNYVDCSWHSLKAKTHPRISCGCTLRADGTYRRSVISPENDNEKFNKHWTKDEDQILIDTYYQFNGVELSNKLLPGRTKKSISARITNLRRAGIINKDQRTTTDRSRRWRYDLNDRYFSEINLETSYWAGFIAADGCIFQKESTHQNQVIIELKNEDEYLLEEFKQDIGYTGPVSYLRTSKIASRIELNSKIIITDLNNNFNIFGKKSLNLKPPNNLTHEQSLAFIKGYIDGDGSINVSKYKHHKYYKNHEEEYNYVVLEFLAISILGTYEFLSWMFDVLRPYHTSNNHVINHKNVFSVAWTRKSANSIFKVLYNILPDKGLKRKWNPEYLNLTSRRL